MKTYFGFALGDSMFSGEVTIRRQSLTPEQVKESVAKGVIPCCNPSHLATIHAMTNRFGIEVEIPAEPPRVSLELGDAVIVMGVRGLPRMTDRHEYTTEEVAKATFVFAKYTVSDEDIGSLGLRVRVASDLKAGGIQTARQLAETPWNKLHGIGPNVGYKARREMQEALAKRGLSLSSTKDK